MHPIHNTGRRDSFRPHKISLHSRVTVNHFKSDTGGDLDDYQNAGASSMCVVARKVKSATYV